MELFVRAVCRMIAGDDSLGPEDSAVKLVTVTNYETAARELSVVIGEAVADVDWCLSVLKQFDLHSRSVLLEKEAFRVLHSLMNNLWRLSSVPLLACVEPFAHASQKLVKSLTGFLKMVGRERKYPCC